MSDEVAGAGLRLVTVAHGTRQSAGNEIARALTAAAGEQLGWPALASYVELCEPLFGEVMAAHGSDGRVDGGSDGGSDGGVAVVVPLLLSTGFHVRVDLPEALARAGGPARMGRPFGPDPLLAQAQVARLVEAGAERGQRVVLVAAGSTDPDATRDQLAAVALLARAWDGPVALATLSGNGERPADVVRPGDAVSPYLLSTGFFHDRIAREVAPVAPDAVVAGVLGTHECVVQLLVERARALAP